MSAIRKVARIIRHAPGIENAEGMWNVLRKPYHQLLNLNGGGVPVVIGGHCAVRIPPEFSGALAWEDYEPETTAALVKWIKEHSRCLILDIGCAIGVFSIVSLFASDTAEVIAFDADLASLKATQRVCHYASGDRLRLVYGFVSNNHVSSLPLNAAIANTQSVLSASSLTGDPGTNIYTCIESQAEQTIPTHTLDELLLTAARHDRPILLKCDIEGAEFLALQGAKKLLEQFSPDLLLSIHPAALPGYGHSVLEVRQFLEALGYHIQILAIDYEEHWWCQKSLVAV
jgi:FkbM family methyltransferase